MDKPRRPLDTETLTRALTIIVPPSLTCPTTSLIQKSITGWSSFTLANIISSPIQPATKLLTDPLAPVLTSLTLTTKTVTKQTSTVSTPILSPPRESTICLCSLTVSTVVDANVKLTIIGGCTSLKPFTLQLKIALTSVIVPSIPPSTRCPFSSRVQQTVSCKSTIRIRKLTTFTTLSSRTPQIASPSRSSIHDRVLSPWPIPLTSC